MSPSLPDARFPTDVGSLGGSSKHTKGYAVTLHSSALPRDDMRTMRMPSSARVAGASATPLPKLLVKEPGRGHGWKIIRKL